MISIKEGKAIERNKEDLAEFSIEDPFDHFHNPGKTVAQNSFMAKRIEEKLLEAYETALKDQFPLSFTQK